MRVCTVKREICKVTKTYFSAMPNFFLCNCNQDNILKFNKITITLVGYFLKV